ncbi:MAG: UMP kinase [Rhodospirillales bacterium]|nr:UMP kinase [Rhodospirillales bacterium]
MIEQDTTGASPVAEGSGPAYKRVLLKLSGEALMGARGYGADIHVLERVAGEIGSVRELGVQIGLVIGGGNIFRGLSEAAKGIERTSADHIGMLATVMNALALQSVLERRGIDTRVMSALPINPVCEPYARRRAVRHLEKGRVVIFAAGTGNPFFTTDTAAALRAVEVGCDVLLKGTQVDGVYSADPRVHQDAERYEHLTYQDVLTRNLGVMDTSAVALARENKVPILVFCVHNPGALADVVAGRGRFTMIH